MRQVLYQLPDSWTWMKIDEIFTITSGKNLTKKDMQDEGEYPVYGGNGIAGRHNDFNLEGSNIIIGRVGALCGNVRLVTDKMWVTDNAFFIKDYKVDILKEYLAKILGAMNLGDTANRSAQPVISYKGIKELYIPYPPAQEQKRIVEKLDALLTRVDTTIKYLQESVVLADSLYASALDKIFSKLMVESKILPFKKLVNNQDGKRIPIKAGERKNTHGTYPYYGATGIIDYVDDYIFEGERLLISEDGANLVARKYPIAFIANGKYWVNNHAHVVDALPELTSNLYLKKFFAVVDLSSYITGSAQPKLSQGKLNIIPVPVPSLEDQAKIVVELDKIYQLTEKLKIEIRSKLDALTLFKASILDSAFKGEL